MVDRTLIIYNGVQIKRGQQLKFTIEVRQKQRGKARAVYIEHTGSVQKLTQSRSGVILKGVTVPGEYSRRFEELPELQERIGTAAAPAVVCEAAEVCA